MFRVHHNYRPDKEFGHTDIDIHIGDVVTNVEYLDNGWSIGYNVNTRKAGIFPRRNIRPIQEDNSSIFPPKQPKYRPVFSEDRVEEYVRSDEIVDWLSNLNVEAFKKAYFQVVHSRRNQYRILKAIVGAFCGIILGILTFLGLHYALEYPAIVAAGIACVTGFILVLGLAFSTKCRAIVCLCLPTLATRSGRFMLSAIAVAILVGGPITNITNNASELASVSSCAGQLLANQTEFIRQLAQEPYDAFVKGLKKTIEEVKSSLETITNLIRPIQDIVGEIRRIKDVVTSELVRAQSRCLGSLDQGATDCKDKMRDASQRCHNFISEASNSFTCGGGLDQNPLTCGQERDAANALCNSINDELCAPVSDIKSLCTGLDVFINVTDLTAVLDKLEKALSTDITLHDTLEGGVSTNSSAEEIVSSIKAELEQRTKLIVDIFDYVNWVLSLTILLVVIKSYIYLRMYLKDDRHDNNYITDCFVKVDEKRLDKGKWSLLPLAPKEEKLVTDKGDWQMSAFEKQNFCKGIMPVLLNIIGGVVVIGFDFLLYEAILLSNKHGAIKIDIKENIDLGVEVEDGGLLSSFLQSILENMRVRSSIDHTIDFEQCLKEGHKPGYTAMIGLGIVYLSMILTVMLNAYALRLRHYFAGYFYEEREKDRVKFLHRKLLRRRVITLKELKDVLMVKRAELENKVVVKDFWDDVQEICSCSDRFTEECYLCETKELTENLHWCEHCNSYFCGSCFNITVNKICPCDPDITLAYDHISESDFEDDTQTRVIDQYYSYASKVGQAQPDIVVEHISTGEVNMRHKTGVQDGKQISDLRKKRNSVLREY